MRFGKVMEVVIMYDQEKKKSRGKYKTNVMFGFRLSSIVTFLTYLISQIFSI